ncbi:Ribonuclease Z, mitochondrial [Chionoecetes opilio]|uniref:ribonuclease Z n=1 Tax=Chionoecetes opilio TaxID=41210 RepID=A0A8J4YI31_CHIOP|nr:Ribonuclease Z, mitochondrial [Chionoecetes opilio]
MEHILVTHKSWENVGGLPGVLLTLQDTGVPYITLHGPPGIASLYYDTRHFLRFKDLNIQYKHHEDNSEPSTDPLIIQNVSLWARMEERDSGDTSENVESVQQAYDGNEVADSAARMALTDVNMTPFPLPLSAAKRLISRVCRSTWNNTLGDALRITSMGQYRSDSSPQPWIRKKSRVLDVTLTRLHLGHTTLTCPRFHSHRVVLHSQLLALNVNTFDLPTLLAAAGVPPSRQHAVIRLTCAFLRKTVEEDLFAHEKSVSRKRSSQEEEQNVTNQTLKRQKLEESISSKNLSVAYICRPPPKAGALRLEQCVKAGVPAGPLLGELKKGNDITLADGRIVRAADVTAPNDPGPVFIGMC